MNYTIEELKNTWDFFDNASKEIIDNAVHISFKFIDDKMIKDYDEYIEKNNFEEDYDFNIFELMSDSFYKENFHSYIIAQLLNNETILKNFLKFIKVDEVDESVYFNEGYEVIPEYFIKNEIKNGRIDILIKSNDKDNKENNEDKEDKNKEKPHCIIIENKLNGAKDEERQLFRYYNSCSENFEVDKIVYISPNSSKESDEQSKEGIPKELIKTIIGYDGNNKDFHTILNDSFEEVKSNSNIEWHLLLKHYLKILRQTGETRMDALTEKFYNKIKTEPQEYKKIKLIATMYNDLIKTRINNLAEKFGGEAKYEKNGKYYFFEREFYSEKRKINYCLKIFMDNDWSWLFLTSTEDTEKNKKKWEEDIKNIEAWLEKHKLFDGFYPEDGGGWTKQFIFPEEENELYEFTKKLIKLLEEDVDSIYSGK